MLVRSCSKPGWLVRMAFAGRIDEEFAAIHECLVETLQVCEAPTRALSDWSINR